MKDKEILSVDVEGLVGMLYTLAALGSMTAPADGKMAKEHLQKLVQTGTNYTIDFLKKYDITVIKGVSQ